MDASSLPQGLIVPAVARNIDLTFTVFVMGALCAAARGRAGIAALLGLLALGSKETTVAVLPEAREVDVTVDPNDLQIDVYRSTGPGGQSVNTTDSAVRITHRPSGIVVACQDEKSQLQNKDKAMRILRARLLQAEQQRQADELSSARRAQVGGGGRSEKIRTYNFKENRVTDHRVGLTVHKLDQVLAGDLAQLLDALVEADRAAQLRGDGNGFAGSAN